jgi:nucleotide-binding universal stress UspA family protein
MCIRRAVQVNPAAMNKITPVSAAATIAPRHQALPATVSPGAAPAARMAGAWTAARPAWGLLRTRLLPAARGCMKSDQRITEGSTGVSGGRRVVVGVSGSPGSLPALRYAEQAARRDEAPLIAVHAWIPPGGDIAERRCPSGHLRQVWQEAARKRLYEALDAAWGSVPAGLRVSCVVVRGETGPALVDEACSTDDLLVLGTGRQGILARISHGRVARYCVAHSVCPVVTVPPPALPDLRPWPFRHRELTMDQAIGAWEGAKLGRERRP